MGYLNKESISGFNYFTPMFVKVGSADKTSSVQDIQLDETVANNFGEIQFLNYLGGSAALYKWYKAASARQLQDKDGNFLVVPDSWTGAWIKTIPGKTQRDPSTYELATEVLEQGDAVQVWTADEKKLIMSAGQVEEKDLDYTDSRQGFNYIGNVFPAPISVQDIQLDETVANNFGEIQFLNYLGGSAALYKWYKAASARQLQDKDGNFLVVPDSWTGAWIKTIPGKTQRDPSTYELATEVLMPGEAAQVWTAEAGKTITVLCPYELK